jgi:hypothetical protein
MVSTASNAPLLARRKTVSAGEVAFYRDAFGPCAFDRRPNRVDLLAAEIAAFAGMWIEARDGDARTFESGCPHAIVGEVDSAQHARPGDPRRSLGSSVCSSRVLKRAMSSSVCSTRASRSHT